MRRVPCFRSALFVVLTLTIVAGATTLQVPGTHPTIQSAINASVSGDVIEVAPGTYFENVNFLGKNIVVRSTGGRLVTIIDGGLTDSVVTIANGETAAAMLDGFTIRNGRSSAGGGGIRIINADPTIKNCIIRSNRAQNGAPSTPNGSHGGGLFLSGSDSHVIDCLVDSNSAGNGASFGAPVDSNAGNGGNGGGAVVANASNVVFERCIFIDNHAGHGGSVPMTSPSRPGCNGGHGGALYVVGSSTFTNLIDCIFENNFAGNGASSMSAPPNDVAGAGGSGGGIYAVVASIDMIGGAIVGCRAGDGGNGTSAAGGGDGGAVYALLAAASPYSATDVVIHRNFGGNGGVSNGIRAGSGGAGGVAIKQSSGTFVRCLFSENHGGHGGLGASSIDSARGGVGAAQCLAATTFTHCRFFENVGGNGGGPTIAATAALRPSGGAGAIQIVSSTPKFVNCVMALNHGGDGGSANGTGTPGQGGPGCVENNTSGVVAFASCTITENVSGAPGLNTTTGAIGVVTAGAYHRGDSNIGTGAFVNSIIWNNRSSVGVQQFSGSSPTGAVWWAFCDIDGGPVFLGNINLAPNFVDASNGDFHLAPGSPCINAGTNNTMILPFIGMGIPLIDIDGDMRVIGQAIDMGADEAQSGSMGGSGQPIVLGSVVNGGGNPQAMVKTVSAGDAVEVFISDPSGTYFGASPLLVAQVYVDGQPPVFVDFDDVHIDPTAPFFLIYGPFPAFMGEAVLGPQGIGFAYVVPAGIGAFTTRFQAFVMTPSAPNGLLVATDAHDLD